MLLGLVLLDVTDAAGVADEDNVGAATPAPADDDDNVDVAKDWTASNVAAALDFAVRSIGEGKSGGIPPEDLSIGGF